MLYLACGRSYEVLAAEIGPRAFECPDCNEDHRQQPSVDYAQIRAAHELSVVAQPSNCPSAKAVDNRASGQNAWVRSLERAQQRCAALAEAAARDRAARAARRKNTVAGGRDVVSQAEAPAVMQSPPPKPRRLQETSRFNSLWDNLASGVPSSLAVTSSVEQLAEREAIIEQPAEQAALLPSESASVLATQGQMPEPPQEPTAPSLSQSTEPVEDEVVARLESASSPATSYEVPEPSQEPVPESLANAPSTEETGETNDLKPFPPPTPELDLPTSCLTSEEKLQELAVKLDEPSGDTSPSLPPDMPGSSMLRSMVVLLQTGLRGF